MNEGLKKMYKYQSEIYYPVKKGWNKTLSKLFCLLASPITNLFYSGLNLISTYKDIRFTKTLKESYNAIKNKENKIMIFVYISYSVICQFFITFSCWFLLYIKYGAFSILY